MNVPGTLGLFLVRRGLITRQMLYDALRLQRRTGGLLGTCLLELGYMGRGELLQNLAMFLGVGPAPPSRVLCPEPSLAGQYDPDHLRRLRALPYDRRNNSLFVAFADPRFQEEALALGATGTDEQVVLRIATEIDVVQGLDFLFGASEDEDREGPSISRRPPRVIAPAPGDRSKAAALGLGVEEAAEEASEGSDTKSFQNDDEIAFARATGFDQERTAVFRLDDLAAQHRKKKEEEAARKSAKAPEVEEPLPLPASAPGLAATADEIYEAPNEGVIARRLIGYLEAYFPRVLLLALHGDTLRGLLARGIDLAGPAVVAIRVPAAPFARLFSDGVGYYGPPPGGKELEPLYQSLGTIGVNALILPIECGQGAGWMIYADHGEELGRYEDVHDLEMLVKEVATALELGRPG